MTRHAWGIPTRSQYETRRPCLKCGLVKVTRHEPSVLPWTEWFEGDTRIHVSHGTPACQPVTVAEDA